MSEDFPDFTRAVRLLGVDDAGDLVTVLVDSLGNLGAIVKGLAPGDVLTAVAVDAAGRIVMVPYGTTTVAGTATVTQAAKDREVQGANGETLRTLAVDGTGQLVMVPRGQSGNYMSVDASGFLSALVKGIDGGAVLRTVAVDTSGQIVMVPRGQSGNYLGVDANGFMTAVLKGAHDAVLTTIGVDANGRIDAFLMDGSDQWGQSLRVGNADLSVRLGSPVTWDWRGNVLYMHDFSTGYGPMLKVAHGTGAVVALGPEKGCFGGYALKMTSGSDDAGYGQIHFYVGSNPSVRLGIAARFAISSNTGYVEVHIEHQEGASSPYGSLWVDVANSQLQIYLAVGGWTNVGAVVVNLSGDTYCWLKLVINQDTGYYERAMYNEVEIDLSAYPCPTLSSSYVGSIMASFVNVGRDGNNDVVYLDQVVLTVNEPVNA